MFLTGRVPDRLCGVTLHAITVFGHDRPGIIAEVTGALAELGVNITDSTMTLLRGHFSMMLVTSGDAGTETITDALSPLLQSGLSVSVEVATEEMITGVPGSSWVLTVHGGDRPGIVSAIVGEVAGVGGNITDLTTRLAGDMYLLVGEVDLPADVEVGALRQRLDAAAQRVGVSATMHPADADEL